jgi:hypothetical protein
MRRDSWQPLINDDDNVGVLIPIIPILLTQQEQHEHRQCAKGALLGTRQLWKTLPWPPIVTQRGYSVGDRRFRFHAP